MPSIMINWEERKIWCNTCGVWIDGATFLNIDGTHQFPTYHPLQGSPSNHTVWN